MPINKRDMRTKSLRPALFLATAVAAAATITAADSWRTTLVASLAGGAILATRLRYALPAAVALVLAVTIVALGGQAAADSQRRAVAFRAGGHHDHQQDRGAVHAEHPSLRRHRPQRVSSR